MSEDVVVVDDAARFRQILGSFPTGVTVVTTVQDGSPVGLAAGSLFAVSLDPPLVGFCAMTTSNMARHRAQRFVRGQHPGRRPNRDLPPVPGGTSPGRWWTRTPKTPSTTT